MEGTWKFLLAWASNKIWNMKTVKTKTFMQERPAQWTVKNDKSNLVGEENWSATRKLQMLNNKIQKSYDLRKYCCQPCTWHNPSIDSSWFCSRFVSKSGPDGLKLHFKELPNESIFHPVSPSIMNQTSIKLLTSCFITGLLMLRIKDCSPGGSEVLIERNSADSTECYLHNVIL